jgi:hypothetical protein
VRCPPSNLIRIVKTVNNYFLKVTMEKYTQAVVAGILPVQKSKVDLGTLPLEVTFRVFVMHFSNLSHEYSFKFQNKMGGLFFSRRRAGCRDFVAGWQASSKAI